jgi:hypothetical protein
VLRFGGGNAASQAVKALDAQLAAQGTALLRALEADAPVAPAPPVPPDRRIPERLTRGPLDFGLPESRLPADAAAWYGSAEFTLSDDARFELVNFVDGRRTVSDIRAALSAEFGPVDVGVVARYFDDLVRAGVVRWK